MDVQTIGKFMLVAAAVLLVVGGAFFLLGKLGVERLPGDLVFRRGNATFYFPIGMMILLSIIGTVVLNLLFRR